VKHGETGQGLGKEVTSEPAPGSLMQGW